MTRKLLLAALTVCLFAASAFAASGAVASGATTDRGAIPGAYIVTLVDAASPDRVANEHARDHGVQVSHIYRYALRGYAANMSAAAAQRVARDPRVEALVPDRPVSAYGKPPKETPPPPETIPTGVARTGGPRGAGAAVAVIDTGIDLDHPDLNVSSLGRNCTTERNTDDGNGHGTHVAGTIGAIDNEIGVVGVAPGTPVIAVKVLTRSGSGSWSSVICGVDWVTAHADTIKVANMSLGGTGGEGSCIDGG
ncbi:MAG: S8 family serine peptidase, partial [Acidimicrobiia bacterium]